LPLLNQPLTVSMNPIGYSFNENVV
jgi:hypothetical protein